MTSSTPTYRVVAGLRVPLQLVPPLIAAIRAKYPEATAGIADPDAAVRAALRAWVQGIFTEYAAEQAEAPLAALIARTITDFETRSAAAKRQAAAAAATIVDDTQPGGTA